MPGTRVMILTAVQIEAKAIARALGLRRANKVSWTGGGNRGPAISLHMTGIRAIHLPAIEPSELRCIVMAGLAGGLSPSLQIGDVVIDDQSTFPTQFETVRGKIHSSKTLIATAADKRACREKCGAVAVDMENQVVRDWAAAMNVPFLGIRAISDRSDQSLDPSVVNAIDEFGRVKPLQLAAGLLLRPARITSLTQIGRHARRAAERLGNAVADVVASIDQPA